MRRRSVLTGVVLVLGALLVVSLAVASGGKKNFNARTLIGYEENPDVSTVASGSFRASVDESAQTVTYELTYSGLEGDVQQAHIHFGKPAINGGVSLFLCSNLGNGPAGTPTCPQSGTVSRTVPAADIVGPTGQGIEAGNLSELVAAMRAGNAYANVHSRSGRAARSAPRSSSTFRLLGGSCGLEERRPGESRASFVSEHAAHEGGALTPSRTRAARSRPGRKPRHAHRPRRGGRT